MSLISSLINNIIYRYWRYTLSGSCVRSLGKADIMIAKSASIINSTIIVTEGSNLSIADGVLVENCNIYVNGSLQIGAFTRIGYNKRELILTIDSGHVSIGHHSKLTCNRVWVRFGGNVIIGNYTNYNAGGEIRADESVSIGDYGMISYNVNIWDTNTHSIYPPEKRREIAEKYWPYFGKELSRPKTVPVCIGNDAWIGENVSILKGTEIGDGVIVGYGALLVNQKIVSGCTIVTESKIRYIR